MHIGIETGVKSDRRRMPRPGIAQAARRTDGARRICPGPGKGCRTPIIVKVGLPGARINPKTRAPAAEMGSGRLFLPRSLRLARLEALGKAIEQAENLARGFVEPVDLRHGAGHIVPVKPVER